MNIEICKKCPCEKFISEYESDIYGIECFDMEKGEAVCTVPLNIVGASEYILKCLENDTPISLKFLSKYKSIQVPKECPYYVEHTMNDWKEDDRRTKKEHSKVR